MSSPTGGVKPMEIETELFRERERLRGMTKEERSWRSQWIKDQVLSPREPVQVCELQRELTNPIKRFYRAPLDLFYKLIKPAVGENAALHIRYVTGKFFMAIAFAYAATYYFKYNTNDWTRKGGWRVVPSRPVVCPGEPGFPFTSQRSPSDYSTQGFENSPI